MMKQLMMMIGCLLCMTCAAFAQQIKIQKDKKLLYITHKVAAKETLYSLGRMYSLTPKEIAAANQLDVNAGLRLGQPIRIPLNKSNFVQSGQPAKGTRPVVHTISKGESLQKIAKQYNGVQEAQLKKWNKLSKSVIKPGQELIVGYVKINPAAATETSTVAGTSVQSRQEPAGNSRQEQEENTPAVQYNLPVPDTQNRQPVTDEFFVGVNAVEGEGYFASIFLHNAAGFMQKKLSGTAATFKSTSGWTDGRYYILVNDLPTESVVKVTYNGKSIYAKVLESLPAIKDNNGLLCRLSNAAASALGVSDAKFTIELVYHE